MSTAANRTELSVPLSSIEAGLRKTTEYFACELPRPSSVAPRWSNTEWRIARAVVTIHGVCGLLVPRLRWQGPPGWAPFLVEQRDHIAQRLPRIQDLLQSLDARAREQEIALVALKGAALYARGFYATGERSMADIDLLVREGDAPRAADLLAGLGYRVGPVTWKHGAFEPQGSPRTGSVFGEDSADPIKIELHSQIREILPLRPVDISQLVWPRAPHAGINDYASHTALLLHVLLHAAGALLNRTARLLHLNDIACLTRHMTPSEWEDVFAQAQNTADPSIWWAYPALALVHRYYGCVPESVLARTGAACRWMLRRTYQHCRLSDVSLSYLWVSAFPGIEWSRSLREMSAYAAERVSPRTETVALRAAFAESQPLVSGGEWAGMSQGRRIVRWLLARQPRQESLQPVRASLAWPVDAHT